MWWVMSDAWSRLEEVDVGNLDGYTAGHAANDRVAILAVQLAQESKSVWEEHIESKAKPPIELCEEDA